MDGQVSTYFDGAASLGLDVAGCIYDVIGKPGIRPLQATPVEARKYTKPTKAEPVPAAVREPARERRDARGVPRAPHREHRGRP
jgi:hypothetical protein